MGFAGNLRTLSLPEVVQTLARIQATGFLRLAADGGHRDVIFNAGQIIGLEFNNGAERQVLLQRMIMQGKIDATAAAAISATGSETQVVRSLVEQGLVSEDDVLDAQANQAEEELISLCTWESADFVFHDSGPEEPEATELVAKFSKLGLSINSGSLLMEAARRMDEWSRLKERLPDTAVVYGVANGQDEGLTLAAADYPAVAVVPLVDAVRTIEDVVQDAVVTRLEVYQVLVGLLDKGLICQLSREDLIAHADYWKEHHNNQLAAKLYRRALAQFAGDRDTQIKLGACLEYLGDSDEAAQCYGQLALGCLDEGDANRASEFGRHAVALRPADPKLRQILARCHFMRSDEVAAVNELKEVSRIYLELGQLEDARGTCLKILELNRGDEYARRELARIFSRVENDQQSEDVVVCVQCGTVNHREALACVKCKCSLQLGCLSCGRVVSVSDRLCIFCGADPHAGSSGRRAGGSPTTSKIINRNSPRKPASGLVNAVQASAEKVRTSGPRPTVAEADPAPTPPSTDRWRSELDRHLGTARANEEAGNYEAALQSWREVAKLQSDNPQILTHIRELELQVNQEAIEQQIDLGHRMSRTRHPWQAARAYRKALHLMSADDPRAKPVSEARARAERDQRKIGMLYGAAVLVIAMGAFLAGRPYYQISRFEQSGTELKARIDAIPGLPAGQVGAEITDIGQVLESLAADAERIRGAYGEKARREEVELRSALNGAKLTAASRSMDGVFKVLQARNAAETDRLLTTYLADFGTDCEPHRLAQAKTQLAELKQKLKIADDERKVAPAKLLALKKHESDKHLATALTGFRELSGSVDPEVSTEAKKGIERLTPQLAAFEADWAKAISLGNTDLARCGQALSALATDSRFWGRETEQLRLAAEVSTRLKVAEEAYNALPAEATVANLESFINAHGAAPQVAQVRSRLASLIARLQGRDQALGIYHQQLTAKQYEPAWQTGRDLISGYGQLLTPGQVKLPLVIESQPAGASVTLAGKPVGRTPLLLGWRPAYGGQEAETGDIELSAPGWKTLSVPLAEAGSQWRYATNLQRQVLWQVALGKGVGAAYRQADGSVLLLAGDTLASLDPAGRVRWRRALAGDDLGGSRLRLAHAPAVFPDGRMAFGLPGSGVSVVDAGGNPVAAIQTTGEIRGRPLVYTNDVFGADTRLAIAGEIIQSGAIGAEPQRIPLPAAAIAGPLALERDLDKVLIVGTVTGHLVGILEQTRKIVWDLDLQATDISQLQPITENLIVTVLDGSKLAAIQIRPELAAVSWSHQLKSPAVGEPALTTNGMVIAAGASIFRFGRDGTMGQTATLPAPASCPVAALGEVVAAGAQDGMLLIFRGEQLLWQTPCGQPVTAVAVLKDRVMVGLQDGTVVAFAL